MTIANRLRTLMRWRGIRSQRQLARLSGVPQTSIHRILAHGDAYAPALATLAKLAGALSTNVPWLCQDNESMRPTVSACAAGVREPAAAHDYAQPRCNGDTAELLMLMSRLSDTERRKVLAVVRLIADRPTWAAADAPLS
jgi:transcriptional regulator with XRE-family HTH domain